MLEFSILLCAYLIGSIPFGLIFMSILEDRDPRQEGSRNIGMSNVMRLSGFIPGVFTLIGDLGKGWLCVWWATEVMPSTFLVSLSALMVVLGHCHSAFIDFQGGKGVATTAGAILALAVTPFLWLALIWAAIRFLTGNSGAASIAAALITPLLIWLMLDIYLWIFLLISILVLFRHRQNFQEFFTKSILQ